MTREQAEKEIRDVFTKVWADGIIKALAQELRKGHWNDLPKYKDIAWHCSECKHFTTMKHNYCPNCGAKMVEPQESEVEE